jgi:hypothetical protein
MEEKGGTKKLVKELSVIEIAFPSISLPKSPQQPKSQSE